MTAFKTEILQVNTSPLSSPQEEGFQSENMGAMWSTKDSDGHPIDSKPDEAVYRDINAGFEYTTVLASKKIYYTSDTLDELIAKANGE